MAESHALLSWGVWVLVGDPGLCGEAAGACPALGLLSPLCQWQGQGSGWFPLMGSAWKGGTRAPVLGGCSGELETGSGGREITGCSYVRQWWMGLEASGAGDRSRRSLWNDKTGQRDQSQVPAYKHMECHRSN